MEVTNLLLPPFNCLVLKEVWVDCICWPYLSNKWLIQASVSLDKDIRSDTLIVCFVVEIIPLGNTSIDNWDVMLIRFTM